METSNEYSKNKSDLIDSFDLLVCSEQYETLNNTRTHILKLLKEIELSYQQQMTCIQILNLMTSSHAASELEDQKFELLNKAKTIFEKKLKPLLLECD